MCCSDLNTIANNDSLATAGEAFPPGNPNQSTSQPGAGIVSRKHSPGLLTALEILDGFSDPSAFDNNIVWQNRQFFFIVADGTPGDPGSTGTWGLCPDIGNTLGLGCPDPDGPAGPNDPVFDDLAVIGTAGSLSGLANLVTPDPWTAPGPTDPSTLFIAEYFNGARSSVFQPEITTPIQAPPAFDEGGNFIRPQYGPLALFDDPAVNDGDPGLLFGDYHVISGSGAINAGAPIWDIYGDTSIWDDALWWDFDGEGRPAPNPSNGDIGADEEQGAKDAGVDELQPIESVPDRQPAILEMTAN